MGQAKAYEILKQLRLEKGLSQKELADKVGLTQQAIALLENGKRKLEFDLFVEILNEIGTTPEELSNIIHSIFSQYHTKEFQTLDDLEYFFSYLESLGYKLSICNLDEMKKIHVKPKSNDDFYIGIQDNRHDNVTFFHKQDFLNFQKEVEKIVDYEIYKQYQKDPALE